MDFTHKYIYQTTWKCVEKGCVACVYKILPLGKASILGEDLQQRLNSLNFPINVRPESCLRSKSAIYAGMQSPESRTLVLGDGDLSFSLSVAQSQPLLARESIAVTSYESREYLSSIYLTVESNIAALEQLGVRVSYQVDATQLQRCPALQGERFSTVVWNFPCVCSRAGADGQTTELEENKELMSSFFANLPPYLIEGAEVHVTHKTIEPFSWWGLVDLAQKQGFKLALEVTFDKYNYPGYTNRKALDKKSFTCNDAKTFIFVAEQESAETVLDKYRSKLIVYDEERIVSLVEKIWGGFRGSKVHNIGEGGQSLRSGEKRKAMKESDRAKKKHQKKS